MKIAKNEQENLTKIGEQNSKIVDEIAEKR